MPMPPPVPFPDPSLGDLQVPGSLLGLLGSFWGGDFARVDQVAAYVEAIGRLAERDVALLREAEATLALSTTPIWHVAPWTALDLVRSELEAGAVADFGDGTARFGDGHAYGTPAPSLSAPAPAGLAWAPLITNRLSDPSRTLVAGIDFAVAGGRITFRSDPLADPRVATRPIFDADGATVDAQATLWIYRGRYDLRHLDLHYGFALGLALPSSPAYRDFLAAFYAALAGGTAAAQLTAALAACCGVPLVGSDGEVVETVYLDAARAERVVVTDRAVYRHPEAAAIEVAAGDALRAGQSLSDTLRVEVLNSGAIPAGLRALSTGPGLLVAGYHADLIWEDRTVPLDVEPDVDGHTKVSFELAGRDDDVAAFWDEVHARGVAAGRTLAMLLDIRPGPVGQPTAASLPAAINPLSFLLENALRANVVLARVSAGGLGRGALGLAQTRLLRLIMPPQEALILAVTMPILADAISMADAAETLGAFTPLAPLGDALDGGRLVAEWVAIRPAGPPC